MSLQNALKRGMENGSWMSQLNLIIGTVHVKGSKTVDLIVNKIIASNKKHTVEQVRSDVEITLFNGIVRFVNEHIRNKYPGVNINFRELMNGRTPDNAKECCMIIKESDNIIHEKAIEIAKPINDKYDVSVENEIRSIYKLKLIDETESMQPIGMKYMDESMKKVENKIKDILVDVAIAGGALLLYFIYKVFMK